MSTKVCKPVIYNVKFELSFRTDDTKAMPACWKRDVILSEEANKETLQKALTKLIAGMNEIPEDMVLVNILDFKEDD